MVLLTITPTILDAIKQYQDRFSEPSTDHVSAPDESSLDDVEVGEPISHGQVIDISRNLIERVTDTTREGNHQRRLYNCDVEKFHLDHLLRGSSVYVAPAKPKPEQTSQYKALMERLRFQEEMSAYQRLLRSDGTTGRRRRSHENNDDDDEEYTFADVNRQLAMIINILVSIVACSCAVWMACSHWSTPGRMGLSLASSGLVGLAEVVVYTGYLRRVETAKQKARRRVETKTITRTWVVGGNKTD